MANEKRLIDANALIKEWNELTKRMVRDADGGIPVDFGLVIRKLSETPTVDAVEVVHGRWIPIEYDGYADGYPVWDLWECSECREEHSGDEDTLTPYCPSCGAKMDLEE